MFDSQKHRFGDVVRDLDATTPTGGEWLAKAVTYVDQQADQGDSLLGRLRGELETAGRDDGMYENGVEAFLHTMKETGDSHIALRDACKAAGLLPSPKATEPVDRLIDRPRGGAHTTRGTLGDSLSKLWTALTTSHATKLQERSETR